MTDEQDFSGGIELPPCAGLVDRRTFVEERSAGRWVVHLGCVDERFTAERLAAGTLLHARLAERADELTGVDLSADGLSELEAAVPGRYLVGDVEDLEAVGLPERCDLVVAGEIIEHLAAPGRFLDGLASYLGRTGATAIITTPNAYSWGSFVQFVVRRRETTHPDHLLVYSPVTLQRAVHTHGLVIVAMWGHRWESRAGIRGAVASAVERVVLRWNPWLALGLVVEVRAATDADGSG